MAQTIESYYENFGEDEFTRSVTEDIESAGGGDFKFENYSQEIVEKGGEPQLKISFDLKGKHFEKLIDTFNANWQYFPFMNRALKTVGLRIFECGDEDPYMLGSINAGEQIYAKKLAFRCVPACGDVQEEEDGENDEETEITKFSDLISVLEEIGWFEGFSEDAKQRVVASYRDKITPWPDFTDPKGTLIAVERKQAKAASKLEETLERNELSALQKKKDKLSLMLISGLENLGYFDGFSDDGKKLAFRDLADDINLEMTTDEFTNWLEGLLEELKEKRLREMEC